MSGSFSVPTNNVACVSGMSSGAAEVWRISVELWEVLQLCPHALILLFFLFLLALCFFSLVSRNRKLPLPPRKLRHCGKVPGVLANTPLPLQRAEAHCCPWVIPADRVTVSFKHFIKIYIVLYNESLYIPPCRKKVHREGLYFSDHNLAEFSNCKCKLSSDVVTLPRIFQLAAPHK